MQAVLNSPLWSFRELLLILLISISIDRIAMATNVEQSDLETSAPSQVSKAESALSKT